MQEIKNYKNIRYIKAHKLNELVLDDRFSIEDDTLITPVNFYYFLIMKKWV